ncbi:MAG TPA: alpha/beta hydrolase [Povalibacter sp.]|uniref:alpha/beta fold hydrolase n=1 Tax=Povalibacter sp. TaxID=1962978 RepID=UPI002CD17188|nr:alpha/beta hydrolase [Povalibacter sp.]HMN47172.1 alpha/beta hydrolase [Povalibacter sp.]
MRAAILAGVACALAFFTPALSASEESAVASFDSGALRVEQRSTKGPPLIFIPGLASGTWAWQSDAERLARTYTVYVVSVPGFDGRPAIAGTTLDSLAQDLRKLIGDRHLERPVLIGHSMGGTLGMAFATEHSGLIAGVIAVDGLPVFPGTEHIGPDRSVLAQGARAQLESQTPEQFVAYQQIYMKHVGAIDEATATKIAELSSRSDPKAVADFAAQLLLLDLRPKLASIKVPVVEISPFHAPDFAAMNVDEAMKTHYYRMLLSGVEKLEVLSVSPARHFVMFDQPEKFATTLDQALAKVYE